jgi:hypothetical protein
MVAALALVQLFEQTSASSTRPIVQDTSGKFDRIGPELDLNFEGNPETAGYEADLVACMDYLREHPYDLNTVTVEELQCIPGLSPADASAVIALRGRLRHFTSVSQLLTLEENGERVLHRLLPYVLVRSRTDGGAGIVNVRSRFRTDTRTPAFDRSDLGGPEYLFERLTLSPSAATTLGIVAEKEAGERVSDGFYSGYLEARDPPLVSLIVLGDYVVEAGQGLVFWRNRYSSRGLISASSARRLSLGIRSYHSASEQGYLRGVAMVFGASSDSRVTCSVFASRRSINGTLDGEGNLKTVDEGGLFRTDRELSRRNVATERLIGSRTSWSIANAIIAGFTLYRSWFDRPMIVDGRAGLTRNVFEVMGIDAMVGIERLHLFGEAAGSGAGGLAFTVGTLLNVARTEGLVLLWHDYTPGFINPHAGGYCKNGETRNERGFHIGVELPVGKSVTIAGSFDQYRFPQGTNSCVLPVGGNDLSIRVDAACFRDVAISLHLTQRLADATTTVADSFERATPALCEQISQAARLSLNVRPGRRLQAATRGEGHATRMNGVTATTGSISQELRFQLAPEISVTSRVVFFSTGGHVTPLYQQEGDVPGAYANSSLAGNGRRWYGLVQWRVASWLELSVRYATTESSTGGADSPGGVQDVVIRNFDAQLDMRL